MNIILVGNGGSGKDQVALMLSHHRIALADEIRKLVGILRGSGTKAAVAYSKALLGNNAPDDLYEKLRFYSQIPRTTKERALLQGIGTYFVECMDDVWIRQCTAKLSKGSNVITDCRRLSELNHFKSLGFKAIYIDCDEELRVQRLKQRDGEYNSMSAKHKSESEIQGLREHCDAVVVNNGTLEELRVELNSALAWLDFTIAN